MKQREWMGYAAAVLAAGAFLTGCGNIRKLAKSDPEVGVHLPARSAQNPVAQAADTASTQEIITYRKQDGTELFITPVDVDSLSGEKMMSVAIDEVVISASNRRNLVERNGKINVEFVVSVPQELQARNWQLVVDPQLLKGADTLAFDPLVYSGDRFRTMQRREYARYDDYLGRIVDSADYFERFGDKRAYARYMDRVAEQRTKYADAEARLERMTPEEAMFDRQVGWTTRGERRRQYARLRRYVTATDRKVRERTSYTPDASDKFDHLNDYFAPRYRHAYTGDDVLPGGGIYTRVQGEYPVDGGREREAYIRSLTENPGRVYGEVYTADDAGIRTLAGRRLAYTGLRRPEVEGLLRETGDSAARENYRIRKEYAADRLAALNALDTAEVRRGMLREGELRRNYERAVNSSAAFARLVRHPYYADARLDTVICRPDGRIDYYYTEQVQADENTSKLYLCLAGEVEDRSGRTYRITRSDTLTYNVASMTTFLDETTRYISPVCGSKAGHGHAQNTGTVQSQTVKSLHRNQKRQSGIQAAGDTDHRRLAVSMLQPLLQAHILNGENLLTAPLSVTVAAWHEGRRIYITGQLCIFLFQMEANLHIGSGIIRPEGGHSSALTHQPCDIQLRINGLTGKSFRFCQNRSIFRNDIMTAKHQILAGLTLSCIGIDISAYQAGRLSAYERLPVQILACGLIAG